MYEYVGKTLCLMFLVLMLPYPWRFSIFICCSCDVYFFHFYLNVIFYIVISMVLSIKDVFFSKEGISADLIAVNEDVGVACWGYKLI